MFNDFQGMFVLYVQPNVFFLCPHVSTTSNKRERERIADLEDFGNGAALDTVLERDVLLLHVGELLREHAHVLPIGIPELVLGVFGLGLADASRRRGFSGGGGPCGGRITEQRSDRGRGCRDAGCRGARSGREGVGGVASV